jgi:hypothetical protein
MRAHEWHAAQRPGKQRKDGTALPPRDANQRRESPAKPKNKPQAGPDA